MLVLSRKVGEKIVAPQCALSVTVLGLRGSVVRLGISAPPEIAVLREELWRDFQAEAVGVGNGEAAQMRLDALAADLTAAAYQIALRHGVADSWVDLELALWRELAATVEKQSWTRWREQPAPQSPTDATRPARLPK